MKKPSGKSWNKISNLKDIRDSSVREMGIIPMAMMDVYLTDVGKRWLQGHYPQGIVWEYDVDKPFRLQAWAAEFVEIYEELI